jgi:hypothetical protein
VTPAQRTGGRRPARLRMTPRQRARGPVLGRRKPASAIMPKAVPLRRRPVQRPAESARDTPPTTWRSRVGPKARSNSVAPGSASAVVLRPSAGRCLAGQALEAPDVEEEVERAEIGRVENGHIADEEPGAGGAGVAGGVKRPAGRVHAHGLPPFVRAPGCTGPDRTPGRAPDRRTRTLGLLPVQQRADARRRGCAVALPRRHTEAVGDAVFAGHLDSRDRDLRRSMHHRISQLRLTSGATDAKPEEGAARGRHPPGCVHRSCRRRAGFDVRPPASRHERMPGGVVVRAQYAGSPLATGTRRAVAEMPALVMAVQHRF